jgi:hypothetical protein
MNARTSGVMLWCVLALLLPLPLFVEQWGWWPLLRTLLALNEGGAALWAQFAAWSALLLVAALAYARLAPRLPPKWPGALVGLLCWVLLVLLATVPVARAPFTAQEPVLLRELYTLED